MQAGKHMITAPRWFPQSPLPGITIKLSSEKMANMQTKLKVKGQNEETAVPKRMKVLLLVNALLSIFLSTVCLF